MLDKYYFGQATRISQEAPVPVVLVQRENSVPGGAANVARNVLSLKGSAMVFGCMAEDEDGRILMQLLKDAGADTDGVVVVPQGHTTVKTRILAGNQQVVRVDLEVPEEITDDIRQQLYTRLETALQAHKLDALVMEDYAKGIFTREFMAQVVALCKSHGVICTLDPHPLHSFDVKGITLMTPNRLEAFALAGERYVPGIGEPMKDAPLKKVGGMLLEKWSADLMLITLGAEGMALFPKEDSSNLLVIPTRARQVFDVSGAGDTVMATMTLAMATGATPAQSAALANYAAGIVVGYVGTRAIDAEELREVLQGR